MIFITLIVTWCLSGNAACYGQNYQQHSDSGGFTPYILPVVKPVPAAIGPFEISSADSSSRIRLQFAGQLRMLFESNDRGSGEQRDERLLMEARRIRLTLTGSLLKPAFSYKLHLSTASHSLELMDYYFDSGSGRVCDSGSVSSGRLLHVTGFSLFSG